MEKPNFELTRFTNAPVSKSDLVDDLRRVAEIIGQGTVPQKRYGDLGKFDYSTVIRKFGSWNDALLESGLSISNEINISDEKLFENILTLWQHYGRQPVRSELAFAPSIISQSPYNRRFRSWSKALEAFVQYANGAGSVAPSERSESISKPSSSGRDPSLRLRWRVLKADNFKCRACGKNPASDAGIELQVDHIVPWSSGGKTDFENLQTLCASCNIGKSNIT
jgi:hypothetical protein